jgi:hypothetical protein
MRLHNCLDEVMLTIENIRAVPLFSTLTDNELEHLANTYSACTALRQFLARNQIICDWMTLDATGLSARSRILSNRISKRFASKKLSLVAYKVSMVSRQRHVLPSPPIVGTKDSVHIGDAYHVERPRKTRQSARCIQTELT